MAAESDQSPITAAEIAADQSLASAAETVGDESPVSAAETDESPAVKKRRPAEVATPLERPSRERKTVERYVHVSPRKAPPPKSITVVQGPGTMLKDIPNVFFKLSKRKSDETLQVLHTILHGRKANARYLKSNILQFSGYVWAADEEKQKLKVKEKLDKLNKDKLIDVCDLLDIQSARSITKKDVIEKLFMFLETPCSTRDVNLAEKKKKGNQKKKTRGAGQITAGGASSERDLKKRKSSPETEVKKRKRQSARGKKRNEHEGTLEEEENEEELSSSDKEVLDGADSSDNDDIPNTEIDDDGSEEENDNVEILKQDNEEKPETLTSSKKSSDKDNHVEPKLKKKLFGDSAADSDKSPTKPASPDAEDVTNVPSPKRRRSLKGQTSTPSIPDTKEKSVATKKDSVKSRKTKLNSSPRKASIATSDSDPPLTSNAKKENKKEDTRSDNSASADNKPANKQASNRATKVSTTTQGKGKASENSKAGPGKEEIRSVVSVMIKKVDFNKTTLKDIVNQLGEHFDMDLMDRKKEIRGILEEVINSMNAEQDSEKESDTNGEEDGEENENENVEEDGKENDDMIVEEDNKDNDDMNAEEDGGEKGAK